MIFRRLRGSLRVAADDALSSGPGRTCSTPFARPMNSRLCSRRLRSASSGTLPTSSHPGELRLKLRAHACGVDVGRILRHGSPSPASPLTSTICWQRWGQRFDSENSARSGPNCCHCSMRSSSGAASRAETQMLEYARKGKFKLQSLDLPQAAARCLRLVSAL
jgi:hypothetical protein